MKRRLCLAFAVSLAFALPTTVSAEQSPIPLPADTKLVVFTYDPNNTSTILTRPNSVTDIALHPEENVIAMALGDTAQWIVVKTTGHVFIKPINKNIATTATLVTDRRTYQLNLRSSPEDGKFYQRVSWDYPDIVIFQQEQAVRARAVVDAEKARLDAIVVSPGVAIENLNFDYSVKGDAEFKPQQVFDDGKFTWLRMGPTQEMPAVFMLPAGKDKADAELVNYNMRGQYLVIQRLVPRLLLKAGGNEVIVTNNKRKSGGFFAFGE